MKGSDEYLNIGSVRGPHGLKGIVCVNVITDIESRFTPGNGLFIEENGLLKKTEVLSYSRYKEHTALVSLKGIDSIEKAEVLTGAGLFIEKKTAEETRSNLKNNEFYFFDLIGLDVRVKDENIGTVSDIIEGGSGHIIEIEMKDGKKVLVPFVDEMVDTSRINERRIDITPIDGLFEQ